MSCDHFYDPESLQNAKKLEKVTQTRVEISDQTKAMVVRKDIYDTTSTQEMNQRAIFVLI